MSANFTSGWLGHATPAWHGQGIVTSGTLNPREAFATANALFGVETRELTYPKEVFGYTSTDTLRRFTREPAGVFGIVRTDTQDLLGVVSKRYEVVENTALLRMAEFIREEAIMDSVVVLADGAKVAFTATLKGASADIVPGDTVNRRFVGYLGHDGKTGCGAIFTNIRVVCQNTLAAALGSSNKVSVRHSTGANANFNNLITSIDVARQRFTEEVDLMREFARVSMGMESFRHMVDEVYRVEEGDKFRKRDALERAFMRGIGSDFAPHSLWNAVNAITQVETSTVNQTAVNARKKFSRANFGEGLILSQRAIEVATAYLSVA